MTKRSLISYQHINAVRLLQAWVMSSVLVCAEAVGHSGSNRFCLNRPDGSFDFFYLVLQWPGSFCSRGCCFDGKLPFPPAQFSIHGLWPAHVGGKSPCFCRAPHNPGPNKMTWDLQQEMLTSWVSFSCPKPTPEGLWRHEWKKHGSCSGMDQRTYFQTAINLHSSYNILEAFHVEGIYPDGQMYDLHDMHDILERYIGEDPIITCSFNDMYQVDQIYEVYICLDKFHLLPSPCPNAAAFRTKCMTPNALFPEFNPLVEPPVCSGQCPVQPPSHQFNSPGFYCTDPSSLALDALNPSDEENLEFYLDSVDVELAPDEDEFQYFLGNKTVDALELDGE